MDQGLCAASVPAALPIPALHPEPDWIRHVADALGYGWARIAWQRASQVEGAWFDYAKADHMVAVWPEIFTLTEDRFAGVPFRLNPCQEVIVRLLFGWKRPVEVKDPVSGATQLIHVRLYRELRLWIARKNGKSEFLSALALAFWYLEGLMRGQGFCFAHNEDQARIVFDKMADMIGYSPVMGQFVQVQKKNLWIQELKSAFRLLSGKAAGKHGRGASVTVGDEMHEWVSGDLADTLRQGSGHRLEPIRLYASTAGLKSQAAGYALYLESLQILDGRIDDPTTLIVIFAADDDDAFDDEAIWPKANPSLGIAPTIDFLRQEAAKAKLSTTAEFAFRRYHLNQWVESHARWLKLREWDLCTSGPKAWKLFLEGDALRERECHLAFDATWTFDFGAMCLRFMPRDESEKPVFAWRCWLPADTIAERLRNERVPFDRWRDDHALTEIPGGTFQLGFAIKAAREACQRFKVRKIGWDSWTAKEFYNALVADGVAEDLFVEMRFGTRTLGEASRSFEGRVRAGALDHGGHPVARWMAGHCDVRFDENMNFVPAKKKARQSIDLIMTAVMTEALAIEHADSFDLDAWLANPVILE